MKGNNKTEFVSSSSGDPMIRFKFQTLLQDYHELLKETEYKMKKLEMIKQKRMNLKAEVRFLRRRYKHLKEDQSVDLEVPSKPSKPSLKRKQSGSETKQRSLVYNEKEELGTTSNGSCDLEQKLKKNRPLLDLNNKVSGFDLNQISGEEETECVVGEATRNNAMVGGELLQLPICREVENVEKELNRAVKRKVTWQDPVALTLSV